MPVPQHRVVAHAVEQLLHVALLSIHAPTIRTDSSPLLPPTSIEFCGITAAGVERRIADGVFARGKGVQSRPRQRQVCCETL